MNGWLLTIIILYVLNLGGHFHSHGKKKDEEYNFWSALFGGILMMTLIYMAIKTGF